MGMNILLRNKFVRFAILEILALLFSFLLFLPLDIAFFHYFLPREKLTPIIKGDIAQGFAVAATFFAAMIFALICSVPHTVLIHRYIFKKYYLIKGGQNNE
jgi:hypothetical protein